MNNKKLILMLGLSLVSTLSFASQSGKKRARSADEQQEASVCELEIGKQIAGVAVIVNAGAENRLRWASGALASDDYIRNQYKDDNVGLDSMLLQPIRSAVTLGQLEEAEKVTLHDMGVVTQILRMHEKNIEDQIALLQADSTRIQSRLKVVQGYSPKGIALISQRVQELKAQRDKFYADRRAERDHSYAAANVTSDAEIAESNKKYDAFFAKRQKISNAGQHQALGASAPSAGVAAAAIVSNVAAPAAAIVDSNQK